MGAVRPWEVLGCGLLCVGVIAAVVVTVLLLRRNRR
jgi:hypothetical protein